MRENQSWLRVGVVLSTLCWGVGDGPSSFQQGGDDTVATCPQNIKKKKKKRSLGLVKKKTQESCFTAGQQMLLTRLRCREGRCLRRRRGLGLLRENSARSPGSIESAGHVVWQGYPSTSAFSLDGYRLLAGCARACLRLLF